ncbi:MAG: glycosyltransferase [Candidatus Aquicultorales bacterium]
MASDGKPCKIICLVGSLGIGPAMRTLSILNELRAGRPAIEASWIAAHPACVPLETLGETVHPFSYMLHSESRVIEEAATGGYSNTRKAVKRMAAIRRHNEGIVADLLEEAEADLVIVDENAELIGALESKPQIQSWRLAYLTDSLAPCVVSPEHAPGILSRFSDSLGWKRYARFFDERVAAGDVFLFVGAIEDIPWRTLPQEFGRTIAESDATFHAVGYPIGFDPPRVRDEDRYALKQRLGYCPQKPLVLASAGGTGLGQKLLDKMVLAVDAVTEAVGGEVQVLLVTGPRVLPQASWAGVEGVRVREFVPSLHEHMAAADFSLVPGGLQSAFELAALRAPFACVTLGDNPHQEEGIAMRLHRYGCGETVPLRDLGPNKIADMVKRALLKPLALPHTPLPLDGTLKAATIIEELIDRQVPASSKAI